MPDEEYLTRMYARFPELPAIDEATREYREGRPVTACCFKCGIVLTVAKTPYSIWVTCPNRCTWFRIHIGSPLRSAGPNADAEHDQE